MYKIEITSSAFNKEPFLTPNNLWSMGRIVRKKEEKKEENIVEIMEEFS